MLKVFERTTSKGQLIEGFAIYDRVLRLQINLDGVKKILGVPSNLPTLPTTHKFFKGYEDLKSKGFTTILKDTPILGTEIEKWKSLEVQAKDLAMLDPEVRMIEMVKQRESFALALSHLIDEKCSRQERHHENEYKSSTSLNTNIIIGQIKKAESDLKDFDIKYPEVLLKIKKDNAERVENFLKYD
jgi:hypothetical protein